MLRCTLGAAVSNGRGSTFRRPADLYLQRGVAPAAHFPCKRRRHTLWQLLAAGSPRPLDAAQHESIQRLTSPKALLDTPLQKLSDPRRQRRRLLIFLEAIGLSFYSDCCAKKPVRLPVSANYGNWQEKQRLLPAHGPATSYLQTNSDRSRPSARPSKHGRQQVQAWTPVGLASADGLGQASVLKTAQRGRANVASLAAASSKLATRA